MNKYLVPIFILSLLVVGVGAVYLSSTQTTTKERLVQEQKQAEDIQKNIEQEETGPKGEDIIRGFFMLINEKQLPGAFEMMTAQMIGGDGGKTTWTSQFNALKKITIESIEPALKDSWTVARHEYKVDLDVTVSPESASAAIPHYGWKNGINTRFVFVEKDANDMWKIAEIGTGQ